MKDGLVDGLCGTLRFLKVMAPIFSASTVPRPWFALVLEWSDQG
jgi:hypothetical protein